MLDELRIRYLGIREMQRKTGPSLESPGRKMPYEQLRDVFADTHFNNMTTEEQRDELLSAMGMMVEWASDVLDDGESEYPLMKRDVRTMGKRFGPWRR